MKLEMYIKVLDLLIGLSFLKSMLKMILLVDHRIKDKCLLTSTFDFISFFHLWLLFN